MGRERKGLVTKSRGADPKGSWTKDGLGGRKDALPPGVPTQGSIKTTRGDSHAMVLKPNLVEETKAFKPRGKRGFMNFLIGKPCLQPGQKKYGSSGGDLLIWKGRVRGIHSRTNEEYGTESGNQKCSSDRVG